jgi:hypothetical protein
MLTGLSYLVKDTCSFDSGSLVYAAPIGTETRGRRRQTGVANQVGSSRVNVARGREP